MTVRGFFSGQPATKRRVLPTLPRCGACGLLKGCRSPKMPVDGEGQRGILITGEAPGKSEDESGHPFVGKTGQLLSSTLRRLGVDLRRDCWIDNALACRPPKNAAPTDKQIEHCRPLVFNAIAELQPTTIILLGKAAVQSVIGWLWKEEVGPMARWQGWRIPCRKPNAWICPTWHPSFVAREDSPVLSMLWEKDLKRAVGLEGSPWNEKESEKGIKIALAPREAAEAIRRTVVMGKGSPIAFDFETDRLKPDYPDSRIVCCSVSDGRTSIAFPWHGEAVRATKELLLSDVPKIGYNAKFEERWWLRHFGAPVRNWKFCGMTAAHVLDNRPLITSLKFQAFVLLGQESYDDAVKPYLKGDGGNGRNRIHEVPLPQLLEYCGMDSLLEWQVGEIMAKKLGVEI